jgi:hypothetical protein
MTVLKAFSDRPLIGARLFDDDVASRGVAKGRIGMVWLTNYRQLLQTPQNTTPHALVRDLSTWTNPLLVVTTHRKLQSQSFHTF